MLPAPPRILTCPYCGQQKQVLQLMSGNTIGARLWSDGNQEAPMLPRVSPVQRCPKCGKFYWMHKQELISGSKVNWTADVGTLSFDEWTQASQQFQQEGMNLSRNEQMTLCQNAIWAYNRELSEASAGSEPSGKFAIFKQFAQQLIDLLDGKDEDSITLKAEMLREIGEFEQCEQLLLGLTTQSQFLRDKVWGPILERCRARISQAFLITG